MTARSFSKLSEKEQEAARVEARKLVQQIGKVMGTQHHPFVWQLVLTDLLTYYVAGYDPAHREKALSAVVDMAKRMYPKIASVLWKGSMQ